MTLRTVVFMVLAMSVLGGSAAARQSVAPVRGLYLAADYEGALAALDEMPPVEPGSETALMAERLRAFCLERHIQSRANRALTVSGSSEADRVRATARILITIHTFRACILALTSQKLAAANAGDADALVGHFTADAVAMPPNDSAVRGAALGDWARNFMSQVTISDARYTENDVVVAGDIAVHRFAFWWPITPKAGGESMTERGKGIHILRRQADGSWKIAQDVWNADAPPPMPPPAT